MAKSISCSGDHGTGWTTLASVAWRMASTLADHVGQVAAAHALGQLLPGRRVAAAGDGDDGVGLPAAVGQPQVPEQPAPVRLGQRRQVLVAVGVVEGVLLGAGDPVDLVEQQHGVYPLCGSS